MAVKTITIDMEAYEQLARNKKPGESFSKVIKRILNPERSNAAHLLEVLRENPLSEEALERIDEVIAERSKHYPEPVDLAE
jgi:predicted CopG family antitoxin